MIGFARRVYRAVLVRYWNVWGKLVLRSHGVRCGRIRLYGLPVVSVEPGSSLRLDDGVTLCSDSRFTALGVARPVVLRTLYADSCLRIGENTGISGGVVCAAMRVEIGRDCLLGADVMVMDTDFHTVAPEGRRFNKRREAIGAAPVVIEDNVFIGAGARILKGVRVGRDSLIGAGAIVTRDVPPGSIVAGPSARVVRDLYNQPAPAARSGPQATGGETEPC